MPCTVPSRPARRPIGQRVRVACGGRYHGTVGTVSEHVAALGTTLYRVAADRVTELGQASAVSGWACLFFPDELRAAPTRGAATNCENTP